ncbi:MAG: pyridoxal-phosphate dependent enzyme [Schleiferiaceae bacterium]|nr:pyridoxal-phosphate dependent enzyme [Schleiferiaceae bacterium]
MRVLRLHPPKIEDIHHPLFEAQQVRVSVKREDGVHAIYGGNKWYKLQHNIQEALAKHHHTILTFGGAFSNHIAATAAACQELGLRSIGVIRGEAHYTENATLKAAQAAGMQLHFVSRTAYREKDSVQFLQSLQQLFGEFYLIPEGGANVLGAKGCEDIITKATTSYSHITLACGTGTTAAGILASCEPYQEIIGIPVFKDGSFLRKDILALTPQPNGVLELFTQYGFGGYAKTTPELVDFINFWHQQGLPLDPIYTGKAFFGVIRAIEVGYFPKGSRILFIHTGGLQGIAGYNAQQQKQASPLFIEN